MLQAASNASAPCDLDLWPFDLESGVRVTRDVGYVCVNFSLPRPLCSQLRPYVRDRQTWDAHQRRWGQRHNNVGECNKFCPNVFYLHEWSTCIGLEPVTTDSQWVIIQSRADDQRQQPDSCRYLSTSGCLRMTGCVCRRGGRRTNMAGDCGKYDVEQTTDVWGSARRPSSVVLSDVQLRQRSVITQRLMTLADVHCKPVDRLIDARHTGWRYH